MQIDFQLAVEPVGVPEEKDFERWASCALEYLQQPVSDKTLLCIRIVDREEISELNQKYRNKNGPTNILSFPAEIPDFVATEMEQISLGDILICAAVVARQADEQGKNISAHWAHLTVHGVLHLLDYDHENAQEAEKMEGLEIAILDQLGFANPYELL